VTKKKCFVTSAPGQLDLLEDLDEVDVAVEIGVAPEELGDGVELVHVDERLRRGRVLQELHLPRDDVILLYELLLLCTARSPKEAAHVELLAVA